VTVMWTWESSAFAAAGSGVCGDKGRAKRAASAWMREHGADCGVVEQVRLAVGAGSLLTRHEPMGVTLWARRDRRGRVRWATARSSA
jgi:hypothetical protein